jgi:DNA processing protein
MTKWSDSKMSWLALKMIPNLGNITYKRLLERFGDPDTVFEAELDDLLKVDGLRVDMAKRIRNKAWEGLPERELSVLQSRGIRLITMADASYPIELREIHDPPPLLYLKGNEMPQSQVKVSVVGSRNPSHYGLNVTEKICQGLAKREITVVSGMATGIDSAAHWGCLRAGGFTVAVLGSGIDIIYPESNWKLFAHIAERGAVITEFPLGSPPEAKNFPIRNRIISGLSKAVVVVEATKRSGSLITASLALDQGREVLAVPGSIDSFKSTGTHLLIKQGAKLVENADDIAQQLGLDAFYPSQIATGKPANSSHLQEDEKRVYEILSHYPLHIDYIARQVNLDSAMVAALLTALELRGIVRQLPGKMFVLQ